MVANIFLNLCLTKGQKASFSLEHEFWPNSYKNIIIDKKGQFKDSRIPGLSFWLQTNHNLVETVIQPSLQKIIGSALLHGFFTIHL
jgi:hypothetical protein